MWTFRVGTLEPASEPFPAGSPIAGDPCVYEGRVIFCPLAGGLYLLDPATGDHQFADVPGPICSGPAVTISGNVWVGNDLGDVYVVEIETLAVEHVARLPQPVRGGFLEQAGRVYVGATMEASRSSDRVLRGPCASWPQAGPFARGQSMRRASCTGLRTMVCFMPATWRGEPLLRSAWVARA